ncbi:hypothetical protein [Singulisphaera sp. PoT]|uniref:hypothetical protein n=1 Tax=Singulisphaera sp. PoT TaxID=3411797 RepID=UPI003BF56642
MSLTVVQARQILSRRCGPWIALADFNDCLLRAAIFCGIQPAAFPLVADGDLSGLSSDQLPKLFDVIEYHVAESASNNCDEVEMRRVGIQDDPGKLYTKLERFAGRKLCYLQKTYNYGVAPLTGGTINLDFQAQNDCLPNGGC